MPHRRQHRAAAVASAAHAMSYQKSALPVMTTRDGAIQGVLMEGAHAFLGIPFAASPVGSRRWAPPAAVAPWKGVLDATKYRHNCLQLEAYSPPQPRETVSEDCLFLNIWKPAAANASSNLPVWFYVHGGSFHSGGANETRLDGRWNAARSDIIMVTANYRLNVFGFLASRILRNRDGDRGSTGNYGILDQRAALVWVQRNIQTFGGDPSRVMLAGQSAGGAAVYNHLVRRSSWGLFSRALPMSGGYTLVLPQPEAAEYERTFEIICNVTRCGVGGVGCLETLPSDALLEAWRSVQYDPAVRLEPVVDGIDLTGQVSDLLRQGQVAPSVPVLAGATREDLDYPLWPAPQVTLKCKPGLCTQEDFSVFLHGLAPNFGWDAAFEARMLAAYSHAENPIADGTKWYWAARHVGADWTMVCPARRAAQWMARLPHAGPSFLYLFSHAPAGPSGAFPALAHHSSELPFVFHVEKTPSGADALLYQFNATHEGSLADLISTTWVNFAATSAPAGAQWLPIGTTDGHEWMEFGHPELHGGISLWRKHAECELWDETDRKLHPGSGAGVQRRDTMVESAAWADLRQ